LDIQKHGVEKPEVPKSISSSTNQFNGTARRPTQKLDDQHSEFLDNDGKLEENDDEAVRMKSSLSSPNFAKLVLDDEEGVKEVWMALKEKPSVPDRSTKL